MSAVILSYSNLPYNIKNNTYNINNSLLSNISINQKINDYISPYFTFQNNIINNNSNILSQTKIDFYLGLIDTIDKLILTNYIKDTQEIMIPAKVDNNADYSITKIMDINVDLLMAYYVIKYSDDTCVDQGKLDLLKIELSEIANT